MVTVPMPTATTVNAEKRKSYQILKMSMFSAKLKNKNTGGTCNPETSNQSEANRIHGFATQ